MEHLVKLNLYHETINELRPFEGEMLKQIKNYLKNITWTQ